MTPPTTNTYHGMASEPAYRSGNYGGGSSSMENFRDGYGPVIEREIIGDGVTSILKGKPGEDKEKLEGRTGLILDEYLHNVDLKETCICISELYHMETIHWLVEVVFDIVVEKKEKDRVNAGKLFGYLLKNESLPRKEFVRGVNAILKLAEDLQIDIPKFWEYFADMIGTILVEKTLDMNFLKETSTFLLVSGLPGKYVSAVLTQMAKVDLGSAVKLWQKSGLSFEDFKVENSGKFVVDNKLDFLEVGHVRKKMQPIDPGFKSLDVREKLKPKPVPVGQHHDDDKENQGKNEGTGKMKDLNNN